MLIVEESQANSKLKEFISHISDEDQKSIKQILNGVYLLIKNEGFTYEEINKPQKSPYHGTLTKIGGSKDLDQLSWKMKVTIPLSYDKQPIAKLSSKIKEEMKSLAPKVSGSYFYDCTNKDFYEAVGFNENKIVEVGRHTDSSGVYYDHNANIVKVVFVFKVVVPRFVEDKSKVDTSANHKFIMNKVESFVEPQEKKSVIKALEEIYSHANKDYDGCIESKRVMIKDAEVYKFRNTGGYDDKKKAFDYKALIWKTELVSPKKSGYIDDSKWVTSFAVDSDCLREQIDGEGYYIGKVSDDYYVGMRSDYGSRDTRYLYFIVLKPNYNAQKIESTNQFLSSDGKNLRNKKVSVSYDKGRKSISGADLTDMINMPRFYTTKKTGLDVAWNKLIEVFDADTTDSDCMRIIGYDKTHMYYAMD